MKFFFCFTYIYSHTFKIFFIDILEFIPLLATPNGFQGQILVTIFNDIYYLKNVYPYMSVIFAVKCTTSHSWFK